MKTPIEGVVEISRVTVYASNPQDVLRKYDKLVKRQGGTFDQAWFERFDSCLRAAYWIRFGNAIEKMPAFLACIISYDVPEDSKFGLDRRQANSLLRSMKLRTPTTREMFQLASQTLETDFALFRVIEENSYRDIAALTPFHPEMPTFMKFGLDEEKKRASLKIVDHRMGTNGGYFFSDWDIPVKNPIPNAEAKKHFPMFLGVY